MLDFLNRFDRKTKQIEKWLPKRQASRASTKRARESLLDFVPRITPRWERPQHLTVIANLFERVMRDEEVRALVSVPPQHGKTELILHGIAWVLSQRPELAAGYASYAADMSRSKSRLARDYALAADVELRGDSKALNEWRTASGGGLLATGVGGPLTGHGLQLLIVDDPHKNRAEAESKTIRDGIHGWYTSTALTRLHPGGSVIVVHTRWHEDDLIGRLSKDEDDPYEVINIPAIRKEDGQERALWESRRPLHWLHKQAGRVGDYDWWSLYMGEPRPRGGQVFRDVLFFDALPEGPRRWAIGVDMAYTKKTRRDSSSIVVMAEVGGVYHVVHVEHVRLEAPAFAELLRQVLARFPGVRAHWYVGGQERGIVDLLGQLGVRIEALPALADKFVRAQPVAAAWNGKTVLLQEGAPWASDFVSEVASFTGVNDAHDDQVDALAAAFDALSVTRPPDDVSLARFGSRR